MGREGALITMPNINLQYLRRRTILLMAPLLLFLGSCISQQKTVYLQDGGGLHGKAYPLSHPEPYRVKTGDNLFIRIDGWEEKTYQFFNPGRNTGEQSGLGEGFFYFNGYPVDKEGLVSLPVLGSLKVEGLTLNEVTDSLQSRLDNYLKDGRVSVRLANFAVTVLGEVGAPGRISVYDEGFTVYDALARAGDIGIYGDRQHVRLVRMSGDTAYTYVLDLTRAHMLSDSLLFLQPDDMIYVEPLRARVFTWNAAQTGGIVSLVISTITLISLLALR